LFPQQMPPARHNLLRGNRSDKLRYSFEQLRIGWPEIRVCHGHQQKVIAGDNACPGLPWPAFSYLAAKPAANQATIQPLFSTRNLKPSVTRALDWIVLRGNTVKDKAYQKCH
jgi:hypothetical protein